VGFFRQKEEGGIFPGSVTLNFEAPVTLNLFQGDG